jgi:hypothetical protein
LKSVLKESEVLKMSKEYIASGLVLGKTWGGGFGAYKSRARH